MSNSEACTLIVAHTRNRDGSLATLLIEGVPESMTDLDVRYWALENKEASDESARAIAALILESGGLDLWARKEDGARLYHDDCHDV